MSSSSLPTVQAPLTVNLESIVKKVLRSRVYDVARETPISEMPILSKRFHNNILIKREGNLGFRFFFFFVLLPPLMAACLKHKQSLDVQWISTNYHAFSWLCVDLKFLLCSLHRYATCVFVQVPRRVQQNVPTEQRSARVGRYCSFGWKSRARLGVGRATNGMSLYHCGNDNALHCSIG